MNIKSGALIVAIVAATGCGSEPSASFSPKAESATPFVLGAPNVTMDANPPPPFTYWAPEGATIRNHPHVPGIWHAFVGGRNVATYFGDGCGASDFQRFVGQKLQSFPAHLPTGVELRKSCETCAVNDDLRRNRMNVLFDESSQNIVRIACY